MNMWWWAPISSLWLLTGGVTALLILTENDNKHWYLDSFHDYKSWSSIIFTSILVLIGPVSFILLLLLVESDGIDYMRGKKRFPIEGAVDDEFPHAQRIYQSDPRHGVPLKIFHFRGWTLKKNVDILKRMYEL